MSIQLKVHPSFFKEFATKTWVSPYEIVKELIENAFDEDATQATNYHSQYRIYSNRR